MAFVSPPSRYFFNLLPQPPPAQKKGTRNAPRTDRDPHLANSSACGGMMWPKNSYTNFRGLTTSSGLVYFETWGDIIKNSKQHVQRNTASQEKRSCAQGKQQLMLSLESVRRLGCWQSQATTMSCIEPLQFSLLYVTLVYCSSRKYRDDAFHRRLRQTDFCRRLPHESYCVY